MQFVFVFFVFLGALSSDLRASELVGHPKIIDGDSLLFDRDTRVRLLGIDAPESAQLCKSANGVGVKCGADSTKQLKTIIQNYLVTCSGSEYDTYNRLLATCFLPDNTNINRMMVEIGAAVAFKKYDTTYVDEERSAKDRMVGIWKYSFERPVDYRSNSWKHAIHVLPDNSECPIKGNINSNGQKIYHLPYSNSYERTRINPAKGERYFCNENEAIAAGWRAVRN